MNVVLVEPEIPPNTGNVARLCAATGAVLHLVGPLGFRLDDRELKRAGMDYWEHVAWRYWRSLDELQRSEEGRGKSEEKRPAAPTTGFWYVTTRSDRPYTQVRYSGGDYLVFGRETAGLPAPLLAAHPDRTITIPMFQPAARSLNLATAVAIVLYEALRQTKGF
jgi:tRNA (cytidine/uridine-2'-O-)-methyltransferase